MDNLKIIEQHGQAFAMLPLAEFEMLRDAAEHAADLVALEEALAKDEEGFPLALLDAIDRGENAVRLLRDYRALTQAQLAEGAGIARAYLAQIETGKRDGTLKTMRALADALEVPLDMLG